MKLHSAPMSADGKSSLKPLTERADTFANYRNIARTSQHKRSRVFSARCRTSVIASSISRTARNTRPTEAARISVLSAVAIGIQKKIQEVSNMAGSGKKTREARTKNVENTLIQRIPCRATCATVERTYSDKIKRRERDRLENVRLFGCGPT